MNTMRDVYIIPSYTPMTLFINNASNLFDPVKNNKVRELVAKIEAQPLNLGAEFSHFWLRDYDKFLETAMEEAEDEGVEIQKEDRFSKTQLMNFINWPEYKHWGGFVRFDNKTG